MRLQAARKNLAIFMRFRATSCPHGHNVKVSPKIGCISHRILVVCALAALGNGLTSYAVALTPEELLPTQELETRATALEKDLRCPVCQNQSIHDSDAELARDLRHAVRQKIREGESDAQIKNWLAARYGTYILMTPPLQATTLPLWLAPAGFLLAACWGGISYYKRQIKP